MSDYADPATSSLRLSDAERAQAVKRLDDARLAGRLDGAEYAKRAAQARNAVVRGDLAPLFTDLPSEPSESSRHEPWKPPARNSRALGGAVGATIMALVPFVALALFFLVGWAGGWGWSWVFFLLVPIAGIIIYGPGADERGRS
ncbi:DUF1707 SHOCT-like domain-containing protein [Agromyces seonyuensis]|uniref:DUF1707 domain-containing protein n=1 Tax=Agromyces seonyuensis TaxID=2662446 RepID=A0A6I4P1R6_9MICO|nr:DUF1707 domain-containing protein [Agromyces seonyuensis]MWB97969.1 DUF1707 domain-containing protein [Agromyces seonyuensis]